MAAGLKAAFAAVGIDPPIGSGDRPGQQAARSAAAAPNPPRTARSSDRPAWLKKKTVGLSRHAIEQFRDRFEPTLNHAAARDRLEKRLDRGAVVFTRERPQWLIHVSRFKNHRDANYLGYLIVDDEMVLPLRDNRESPAGGYQHAPPQSWIVVTCMDREMI